MRNTTTSRSAAKRISGLSQSSSDSPSVCTTSVKASFKCSSTTKSTPATFPTDTAGESHGLSIYCNGNKLFLICNIVAGGTPIRVNLAERKV